MSGDRVADATTRYRVGAISTYSYHAARGDGRIESGLVAAPSRDAAVGILTDRGLWVIELQARNSAGMTSRDGRRTMRVADLALGLRLLADFLEAGLSLSRALSALEEVAPPRWREILPALRENIRQGKSLAASLSLSSAAMPSLVIGMVHAGEAGGGLAPSVKQAAEILEEAAATRAAIWGALAYPIILAATGTASVTLLVCVVLPRFALLLADVGQALPATTRLVLGVAETVRFLWIPTLALLLAAAAAWRVWTSTEAGLRRWHALLLELPIYGGVHRSAAVARGCGAVAALLGNGVPIASALAHGARATGDAALAARLLTAREAVTRGERLSRALALNDAATPSTVRLVRAGEESGRLAAMLAYAARWEREQATARTRALVHLLEPALILAFGGVVAVVAAALLQAMYSVRPGT